MPTSEITLLGRCPTCRQHRVVSAACRCGHEVWVHSFGFRAGEKVRSSCTRADATGPCGCKEYVGG